MGSTIQSQIDEALARKQAERANRVRSGKWSPSSFGYCFRRQFWNRKNEPVTNPPDARSLRVFACGDFFHDFVKSLVRKELHREEVKCESADTFGYADIELLNEVVDIKSQHSRAFWHMTKEAKAGKSILEIKPENVLQVAWYAIQLGKEFIRLIYVSKDDLCCEEFRLRITPEIMAKINAELAVLNDFWKNGKLPSAQPRAYGGDKECGYCQFKDKCFEMEKKNERPTNKC